MTTAPPGGWCQRAKDAPTAPQKTTHRMEHGGWGHVRESGREWLGCAVRSGTQRARRLLSRTTVGPWRPGPHHCPASYALRAGSRALLRAQTSCQLHVHTLLLVETVGC